MDNTRSFEGRKGNRRRELEELVSSSRAVWAHLSLSSLQNLIKILIRSTFFLNFFSPFNNFFFFYIVALNERRLDSINDYQSIVWDKRSAPNRGGGVHYSLLHIIRVTVGKKRYPPFLPTPFPPRGFHARFLPPYLRPIT